MKKQTIKEFTEGEINRVTATMMSIDWSNPAAYGDFLAQTYYHICHSTRLLAAAAARFPLHQEKFHLQCMRHSEEERSHEKLSLSDLKEIGYRLEEFSELPGTKSLYRSNYFLIEHVSPLALFGYAYFLEWIAIAGGEKLMAATEPVYGSKAVKHMHVHTKEDPEHLKAYEGLLEEFSGEDREILIEAIATTAADYERIYLEINARAGSKKQKRAA